MKFVLILLISLPIAAFIGGFIQGGSLSYRKIFGKNRGPASVSAYVVSVIILSVVF